jgi:predicted acetyltransferase
MDRADTPAVSHGRQAAKEAARAKRTLDPTLRQPTDRRHSPFPGLGESLRPPRSAARPAPAYIGPVPTHLASAAGATVTAKRRRQRPVADNIVAARAGDHPDIYQFLLEVFQSPSREEFYAVQDDPTYEPGRRLLVKQDGRIAAHVQLSHRSMCFGGLQIPITQLDWLGTLPQCRAQGIATRLMHRAEQEMRRSGAALGILRTKIPQFFHRSGWAVCGRQSFSSAKAREILARLSTDAPPRPPLNIRLWRHVELPSLLRIYGENTATAFGALQRSEAYWRWLISRKAFDHIIVAIHGRDRLELVDTNAPIVGYAVVRQGRILELLTSPAFPTAGRQLLARACSDSIERNRQSITIEAPPADPLHQIIAEAGGLTNSSECDGYEVQMVKVLDIAHYVRVIEPLLIQRAQAANLTIPCELGLLVEGTKHALTISRTDARLHGGRLGRSYLTLKWNELTRLLLGHSDPAESVEQQRITPSTQTAFDTMRVLFPKLPFWRPRWDEAQA